MCDHDDIGFGTNNAFGPADVWVNDPFSQGRILDIRKVPRAEDGGFKDIRFRIIDALQVRNGLFFAFLSVCIMSTAV